MLRCLNTGRALFDPPKIPIQIRQLELKKAVGLSLYKTPSLNEAGELSYWSSSQLSLTGLSALLFFSSQLSLTGLSALLFLGVLMFTFLG